MTVRGIDETDLAGALADFTTAYAAALATHLDAPVSAELTAAAQLGREARRLNISMLQLVGRHLEVRRAQVLARGTDRLVDMDRFLSAVLAAFEEASDGEPTPFAMSRDRIELLRGLSDAYLAIASGTTLDARVEEVCTQARRFFGAADARLVFGREAEDQEPHPPADVMAAHLLGSAALLTVYAVAGRRWTDGERTMLQQLAALISAPINDARRLEAAQHAAELGRLLGGVVEPVDVLARFRDEGVGLVGADRVVLVGADQANADDDACDEIPPDVRATIAAVASSGSPRYLTDRPDSSSMVWAVLPVTSGSQRFAVMVAGFDDPQPFDDVQQSFLADMTGRLGAALERSEAYANEQTARRDAERASARWRDLQGLAADLATAATRRRVAQTLLRSVLASGHLDSGLVAMYATRPQVEVLAHSRALRSMQGELAAELVKLLSGVDGRARNGLLHYVDVADMAPELREPLAADGVTAVTGVAIMAGARQVGMLVLARRRAARGSHDEAVADVELLDAQVAMAGATLQRGRSLRLRAHDRGHAAAQHARAPAADGDALALGGALSRR